MGRQGAVGGVVAAVRSGLGVLVLGVLVLACSSEPVSLEESLAEAAGHQDAVAEAEGVVTDGLAGEDVAGEDVAGEDGAGDDGRGEGEEGDTAGEGGAEVDAEPGAPLEDRFAVPEVIDEAYADLVINELLRVVSDALRAVLADEDPGGVEAEQVFRAVYGQPVVELQISELQELFVDDEGRSTQRPLASFGRQRFETVGIHDAQRDCVTVFGHYDVSATSLFPFDPDLLTVVVLRADHEAPSPNNPSGWLWWDSSPLYASGEMVRVEQLEQISDLEGVVDAACGSPRGVS